MEAPPVLDLAPFIRNAHQNDEFEKLRLLEEMKNACVNFGLFQIINHGVDCSLLQKVLYSVQEFYKSPLHEKMKCRTDRFPFGFVNQSAPVGGSLDKKEHFFCAMEDHPACNNNVWPDTPANFRKYTLELGGQMQKTAQFILTLLAQSLNLSEEALKASFLKTEDYFNVLYYPGICDYEGPVLSEHQDGTIFTLVAQLNSVAGYQVFRSNLWHTVFPEEGALIVNIGDILQASTNGHYLSALHRVIASKVERFSFVYHHVPSSDTEIYPLEQFTLTEPAKYRPFKQSEYLKLRGENKKVNSALGKLVTIEHYAI